MENCIYKILKKDKIYMLIDVGSDVIIDISKKRKRLENKMLTLLKYGKGFDGFTPAFFTNYGFSY